MTILQWKQAAKRWRHRARQLEDELREARLEYEYHQALPDERKAVTVAHNIGQQRAYLTMGEYDDGELGEVMIKIGKHGGESATNNQTCMAISLGLQWGVPVEAFVEKFEHQRIGDSLIVTDDPKFPVVKSIIDWVAKRMRERYMKGEENGS